MPGKPSYWTSRTLPVNKIRSKIELVHLPKYVDWLAMTENPQSHCSKYMSLRHKNACSYVVTSKIFLGKGRTLSTCILSCRCSLLGEITPHLDCSISSCSVGPVTHPSAVQFPIDSEILMWPWRISCQHPFHGPSASLQNITGSIQSSLVINAFWEEKPNGTYTEEDIIVRANPVSHTPPRIILEAQLPPPSSHSVLVREVMCPCLPRTT